MALRMERSSHNASRLASFLAGHPAVRKVNYAGLPGHPGADLHARQASSAGAVLSFETGNDRLLQQGSSCVRMRG